MSRKVELVHSFAQTCKMFSDVRFFSILLFYSGTESIHTSVCNATAAAAAATATTARFLISS